MRYDATTVPAALSATRRVWTSLGCASWFSQVRGVEGKPILVFIPIHTSCSMAYGTCSQTMKAGNDHTKMKSTMNDDVM
jgi:hypothetical protein